MKDLLKGLTVLVIGGSAYSFSQADLVENFSNETGMSAQEAEQYIENIPEDEFTSFDVLGTDLVSEGEMTLEVASEIDCQGYEYEWESSQLSCANAKDQLETIGSSEIALGNSYITLNSDSATSSDIANTIVLIDELNENYSLPILEILVESEVIDEMQKTNSYNKSLLQSALDSE